MALLFAAILAMVATDVMAQRGGGGRPGGGRPGGFGGPGGPGGFGGRGGFGGSSLTGLLRVEAVQEEIELMPDQKEAVEKINESRPQTERPEGIDFRDRSEENRAKLEEWMEKARKEREEFEAKAREQLEEVLLPNQMERLEQIEVQLMGVRALMNDRVAKALKLTTAQKDDLQKTSDASREEMMSKMREIFSGGGGDRDAMREKMQAAQKEAEDKLLAVLTSDQKKDFEAMKGEPFEMPERGGFGGRGPGGPGGFGGRGPGGPGGGRGGRGGGRPPAE